MSKGAGCGVHILALQLTSSVISSKFLNFSGSYPLHGASLVAQMVKSLPEMQRPRGSILGSGRSRGEGNGNPFQYSCLEDPMDGGAWQAPVYEVAKSQTQLSN